MINFKSLRFKNAVSFHETSFVPLQGQGRVFLEGKNIDTGGSNGAGKSTIWEILQHILFSTTSKGFARGKFAEDGYFAELVLEVDDHEYKILQFRGAKKQDRKDRKDGYKIKKDGIDVTPKGTRHMADCIAYIKEIIGITEEEFRGYIYLAQEGQGHVLISGKGSEKRNYLSDLFNLDRYDLVKEGVESELSVIKSQIGALSEKAAVRDALEEQLEEIPLTAKDFEALSVSIKETETFITEKEVLWSRELKTADAAIARATERKAVQSRLDSLFPSWQDLDVEEACATRQSTLRKLTARIDKLEEIDDLLTEKEELSANYVEGLKLTEEQAREALTKSQTALASLKSELQGVRRRLALEETLPDTGAIGEDVPQRLKDTEGALEVIKHKLAEGKTSLGKLSKLTAPLCPTCGQDLDVEAIAEQKVNVQAAVATMKSALVVTSKEIEILSELAFKLEEHSKITTQIGELPSFSTTEHKESIDKCKIEIEEIQETLEQAKENSKVAKRLAAIVAALTELPDNLDVSKLEDYKEKVTKLTKSLGKLETIKQLALQFADMEEVEVLSSSKYEHASELASFYKEALAKLATQKQEAITQKEHVKNLQQRLEELEKTLAVWEEVQHKKALFEAMKAAYGPKGLKIHQLKKVCNAICKTLPKYTTIMFQEPRIEFFVDNDPDSLDIEFYVRRFTEEGTEEYPVGKLSGGEKKRLAVAMIFSLAELVSPRKRSNLVILDEVGDGLDPMGEEAFASQLLPQLTQDTVICTSHRPGIASAQFDKKWLVTKNSNQSVLAVAKE